MLIHSLVEAQARRAPQAPALAFGGERLTYAELEGRANRLARALRRRGVGPEALVGVAAERSVETVVGLLAVLKAGGAYVPLDPSYPSERLAFMWGDASRTRPGGAAPVLLTQERTAEAVPAHGAQVLRLDADAALWAGESAEPLPAGEVALDHDHLAYVIYTSGSTGRPKGVLIAHRGVVNVIRESARLLDVGPESRVLQLASLSFDASVLEIFTALSTGACLVLTRRETLLSGEALGRELAAERITTIAIPPSLLDKVPEGIELPALRSIVVGGEACSAATAARWAPGRRFVNAYAPTEATIFATAGECTGLDPSPPAIGVPIAETEIQLLGPDGTPVPPGEPGEICLGGAGVARGYLHRPDLTAERFVPAADGGRLYRSGDLGRRRPDGSLEFIGRVDFQVKVRGYRIELGEIEAVLGEHPAVRSAVVAARQDGEEGDGAFAEKRLVAYVVPRGAAAGLVSALRAHLAERLPDYMVPAAFVFLDALPMAATGKVDRKALPAPDRARPALETAYAAPSGPVEEALAQVWGELLGLDRVGARDNLFALGGHSLLVAQIVSRVRQDFGVELPIPVVFEHPTIAALAARIAAVRTGGAESDEPELPPVERVPRDRPLPLSFTQERVWFLNQLSPGAIAYNFQFTLRFRGPLDRDALARTLTEVVRRHEVLRTTFPARDGRGVQVIHPPFAVALPVVDLTALPPAAREARAERIVRQEIRRGFDVAELPLLRWTLLRLAPDDHLLLQVEHHFVHDGWSLALFLREVKEIYRAFSAGLPSPLPEPPIQYADFAVWQRRFLDGQVLARQLGYWKERLGEDPPVLQLPTDHPRPKAHSFRGDALRVDLPHELYEEVRAFGRREGSTLFVTMLSVFDALLDRMTGQDDFLLGSGVANRRLRETEQMIGMVVNTVVLRTPLASDLPFRDLMVRARRTMLEAHQHQDLPFEKLVQELQPDRDLSRNPLFQVLFSFHDAPVPDLDFGGGLAAEIFERHNSSAKSDLNVVVKPRAEQRIGLRPTGHDELTMVWEFATDLYERATIERMWGHYQNLLRGVVEDAGRTLAELPLLSPAEQLQLAAWNETAAPAPAEPRVQRLVEAQAARTPAALAVAMGPRRLAYGELNAAANRLARKLRALGAGPEVPVGVLLERSPELVVAELAALKTGGAYLPLDPVYPPERLAFMLEDAGVAALVTDRAHAGLVAGVAVPVLVLDEMAELAALPDSNLPDAATDPAAAARLAYVIYTSGSTGHPKGVEVTHGGLANLVAWHRQVYGVGVEDRATLVAGPAFDASVWEVWPYLTAGASLHVPDAETRAAPERLLAWLVAERVTLTFLPTPLAEAAVELPAPEGLELRAVLTGGDRLRRAPAAGLPYRLVNHYGPTENSVVATAGEVPPAATSDVPPGIGRAIANTRLHVLDRDGNPTPVGVPGELFVGGAGLARGYRGRPDLTAERFVPDAWSEEPGARLYRTGDLVRWRSNGELEFLGRTDHQVKVRGFRIELGEIEAVLARYPAVKQAVVVARGKEDSSEKRLVAYVVPHDEAVDADALRAHLAATLPDYMVPSAFVLLPSLPLTPNGKVDLRALPEPELEAGREEGYVAPRTPLEELLAGIWAQVVGVPRVGAGDHFFRLGGHSLLATQVLSRVRDAAGAEVPLAALFEEPVLAGFARAVEARLRGGAAAEDRIPRRPAGVPIPLSFAQERLWFLDRLAPGNAAYNIARAWRLAGPLDAAALAAAVRAVVARHEALRTTFAEEDGQPVQRVAEEPTFAVAFEDLTALPPAAREATAAQRAAEIAGRPYNLARRPPLRVALLRLATDDHRLLLGMHHIVADGWSMGRFLAELGALAAGAVLPPLPVQYGDFALWQRGRLTGETLAALNTYWHGQLAGAPALLELPTDRRRPAVQAHRGDQETQRLSGAQAAALRELVRGSGATLFMTLAAALAALFHRLSGQADVVLGTPIVGRTRSELEPLVGFFVNTAALRVRFAGDPTFAALVAQVREATLAAHAHQEMPFEKLVEELAPERNLGHSPIFQVLFALQNTESEALALPGVEALPLPLARGESRFDLELIASETADGGLEIAWRYDRDLWDGPSVARMAGSFATLLDAAATAPDTRVLELEVLTAHERRQLPLDADGGALPAAGDEVPALLHRLVEAQVARTPEAVALVHAPAAGAPRVRLTYRDLNRRANRLAHRLRALGVGPEARVGVSLERAPEMVTALLAVLKAGGAYVPLDPAYPAERLGLMLEDARAGQPSFVLLTQERLLPRLDAVLAGQDDVYLFCLDRDRLLLAGEPEEDLPDGAAPANLSHVIYTSGSTGRPKGVAIEHRSGGAFLRWALSVFTPQELAGVFASTSINFDLSVGFF